MNENEINKKEGPEGCKFFDSCSVNLCPLDPRLKEILWCPEENDSDGICKNREFAGLQFVRTQKRIARATRNKRREREDYFSFEMLNRNIVVRSGIEGIPDPPDTIKDPEKWYSDKERKWILNHPEKKQLSSEEIERRRLRMKSIRKTSSAIHFQEMIDSKGVVSSLSPQSPLKSIDNGGNEE
jgi:hypothetical protein